MVKNKKLKIPGSSKSKSKISTDRKKKSGFFGLFTNKKNLKKQKEKLKIPNSVRIKSISRKKISLKEKKNKSKLSSDRNKKSEMPNLSSNAKNFKKSEKIFLKEKKNKLKISTSLPSEKNIKEHVKKLIPENKKKKSAEKKMQDVKELIPENQKKKNVGKEIQDGKKLIPKNGKGDNKEEHIKTYIPGFDALIKEGIPRGSAVLVEGGPGSGKTIFCLSLVKTMCEKGKKVLYMSFEETEEKLKKHMGIFGAKPAEYEKKGLLYVKRFNALDIARSIEALLSEAKKELLIDVQPILIPKDFEPDIVLIDSLTSIGSAFSGEENRFRIYMEQLFRYLESHDITSFLVRETCNPTHIGRTFVEKSEAVSFLSDGIIVVYNVVYEGGARKRALEFLKMRGAEIDRRIVEVDIKAKQGIIVYPNKTLKGKYLLT